MSKDWDPTKFCVDEECEIERLHPRHRRLKRRPVLHHRPVPNAPLSIDQGGLPKPSELLAERVLNAIGELPMMIGWIQRDVRDDYGSVTDRTIYRHVKRLVQERKIIKLDVGLAFCVYMRPTSRYLHDHLSLYEYLTTNADCIAIPFSKKERGVFA